MSEIADAGSCRCFHAAVMLRPARRRVLIATVALIALASTLAAASPGKGRPRHLTTFAASAASSRSANASRARWLPGPADGYGIYESCDGGHQRACLAHLDQMANGGLKLVLNYEQLYGNVRFERAYLARARALGMKVIVPLSNPAFYNGASLDSEFPALAQTCRCRSNAGFIAYLVHLFKRSPAVWGYYIGDEVDPADHNRMKARLADLVGRLDPGHPRLFIDTAGHAVAVWHGNSPFADTAGVLGSDFYPIRLNSPDYPTIRETAAVATGIQAFAHRMHRDAAIVLQAFSYSDYGDPGSPYPTAAQMRYMLAQTLTHSRPRLILWYSFYDTMAAPDAGRDWRNLQATIRRRYRAP
jgi:hypothetical protein